MGTLAARGASLLVAAMFVSLWPMSAAAGTREAPQASGNARSRTVAIQEGHDGRSGWMVARYRQLQIGKRFDSATGTVIIELRAGSDLVQVSVGRQGTTVSRDGRTLALDRPEAIESLQQLVGGSLAVFTAREMFSQLESEGTLDATDMSLLSAVAFVASLVGDPAAPRRLTDRFVAKHRGFFRQVSAGAAAGSCWDDYVVEVVGAWTDLQDCMEEANQDDWYWAPVRRVACNAWWILRSEAAWFQFVKCLSPLGSLPH